MIVQGSKGWCSSNFSMDKKVRQKRRCQGYYQLPRKEVVCKIWIIFYIHGEVDVLCEGRGVGGCLCLFVCVQMFFESSKFGWKAKKFHKEEKWEILKRTISVQTANSNCMCFHNCLLLIASLGVHCDPPTLTYGLKSNITQSVGYGVATGYACKKGLVHKGRRSALCGELGKWTGQPPTCQGQPRWLHIHQLWLFDMWDC